MSAPNPQRLWPVVLVLALLLFGLLAVEQYARRRGNGVLRIAIRQGTPWSGDDEGEAELSAAVEPPVSPAHAEARAAARRGDLERAIALYRRELDEHPEGVALRRELGVTLMGAGQLELARAEIERLARQRPDDPRVALTHGLLLRRLGDLAGAEDKLHRALALLPSSNEARTALAALYVKGRRWPEALAVVEPATRVGGNRDRASAWYWVGRAELGARHDDAAKKAFDEAITWAPAEADLRVRIGRAYLERGGKEAAAVAASILAVAVDLAPDLADAERAYGRALEALDQERPARLAYERAVHLDPTDRYARIRLLRLALGRSDFVVAQAMAQYLLEQAPEVPEHHFLAGLVAARAGRTDAARTYYQNAAEKAGGNYPEAYFNLGLLEKRAGQLEAAIAAYDQAITQRPDYLQALNNQALAFAAAGRPDQAERALRRALELSPSYAAGWLNLGELLGDRGRGEEAIQAFRSALAARPDYPEAALDLGVAYARAGRADQAIATYEKLLQDRPRYVPAIYNLALALEAHGRRAEAKAALARVLAVDPEHRGTLSKLAALEADEGSVEAAITSYQTLLEQQPSDRSARLTLAELLHRQGDLPACTREVELAVAGSNSEERQRRLRETCGVDVPAPAAPPAHPRN